MDTACLVLLLPYLPCSFRRLFLFLFGVFLFLFYCLISVTFAPLSLSFFFFFPLSLLRFVYHSLHHHPCCIVFSCFFFFFPLKRNYSLFSCFLFLGFMWFHLYLQVFIFPGSCFIVSVDFHLLLHHVTLCSQLIVVIK